MRLTLRTLAYALAVILLLLVAGFKAQALKEKEYEQCANQVIDNSRFKLVDGHVIAPAKDLTSGMFLLECGPTPTQPLRDEVQAALRAKGYHSWYYPVDMALRAKMDACTSYDESLRAFGQSHPNLRVVDIKPADERESGTVEYSVLSTTKVILITEPKPAKAHRAEAN